MLRLFRIGVCAAASAALLVSCAEQRIVRWEDVDSAAGHARSGGPAAVPMTSPSTPMSAAPPAPPTPASPKGPPPPATTSTPDTGAPRATASTAPPAQAATPPSGPPPAAPPIALPRPAAPPAAAVPPDAPAAPPDAPAAPRTPVPRVATLVRVTGHGAVCLSDARAIVDPAAAHRRLAAELSKQAIAVEGVAFTRLVRDPARSVTDPPPQACRLLAQALGAATPVSAPLQLSREPTAAWFAVTSTGDVVTDAAAVLLQAVQQGHAVAGPPRLLLDDAFALASIAVPVEPP